MERLPPRPTVSPDAIRLRDIWPMARTSVTFEGNCVYCDGFIAGKLSAYWLCMATSHDTFEEGDKGGSGEHLVAGFRA